MRLMAALLASLRALVMAGFATGGAAHAQQPADADDAAWGAAERAGTADAYQRYLEEFPVGRHVEEAFRGVVEESLGSQGGTRGVNVDMY